MRHSLSAARFAPLVPIASLLTVIVTLVVSGIQTHSTNQLAIEKLADDRANRDAASWKAFEDELDKREPDELYASPTFVSRLRAFKSSGKYDGQIGDVTTRFMSKLSSASAFRDIWNLQIQKATLKNIDTVVELARAKKPVWDQLQDECFRTKSLDKNKPLRADLIYPWLGVCSSAYSDDDLADAFSPTDYKTVRQLRVDMNNFGAIDKFLSDQIAEVLRESSNKRSGPQEVDVSNIIFQSANLDEVDFSKADLTGTIIATSTLKGAVITPKGVTYDF